MISYVFACNKNNALQLQRVPVLSILGCNNDLYFKQAVQFPKPKTAANLTTAPSGQRSCYATANRHCRDIYSRSRYDTRCYFNVRSKADISQLNLPLMCLARLIVAKLNRPL